MWQAARSRSLQGADRNETQHQHRKKAHRLWLVILAAVLYVAGAVALFLMMRSAPEVAYHGETYRLTGYAETFSDYTFDFASDSGTTVHGARAWTAAALW